MSDKKSFWNTLPGLLTGVAGVITAIGGFLVVLHQIGIIEPKPNGMSNETSHGKTKIEHQIDEKVSESKPFQDPAKQVRNPTVLQRSLYRSPALSGEKLYYYDFDKPQKLSAQTPNVDFFYKPDSSDKDTKIGVVPHNGAIFAPQTLDLFPWELDQNEFTTAQGVYSVPQNKNIPCISNDGTYCTFKIWIEEDGELAVSFVLYELR
jgi:hypothetical protein